MGKEIENCRFYNMLQKMFLKLKMKHLGFIRFPENTLALKGDNCHEGLKSK